MTEKKNAPLGANVATGKQRFLASLLNPIATTGAWAYQLAANIFSFHKVAAATVSVVNIAIPYDERGGLQQDGNLTAFSVDYAVATANCTSAPTLVLRKLTKNAATGVTTSAVLASTLTFTGTNTVGSAIGTYNAVATVTTPAALGDDESLVAEMTMNEAATTVLDIFGATATYQ